MTDATLKQVITQGFGILLLTMAVCQFLTFGYFNHIIYTYLTPAGEGTKLLSLFVTPVALSLIALEAVGAIGLLGFSSDNVMRSVFIKMGVVATLIWSVLIVTILVRDAPIGSVGFFGEHMKQLMGWHILLQSLLFAIWGYAAYILSEREL